MKLDLDRAITGSGGIGGGGCFLADTVVWTPDGFTKIQDIRIGDLVYAFNPEGKIKACPVTNLHIHEGCFVSKFTFYSGHVLATPNHAFLTERNTFKEIGKFKVDENLIDFEGDFLPFEGETRLEGLYTVYNLRVEEYHTYFVTHHRIAVHNGGGGKSSSSSPEEEGVLARSTARAEVIELISEGEIEGLPTGAEDIFLDETPVKDDEGNINFDGFKYSYRRGKPNQKRLKGFSEEVASETSINVEVLYGTPSIRTIVNNEVDVIRIRLGLQLQEIEEDGDIEGDSITFRIEIQQGALPYEIRLEETIEGRLPNLTEYEYNFPVDNQGGTIDTFNIRITKVSEDSASSRITRTLRWQSYTEVVEAKLNYAYSAIIGMQFDSKQFSSVPTRGYRVYGILCKIPSNATVQDDGGLTFSGTWDGTLYKPNKATSDPAWQLLDILTNERYGLGRYLKTSQIDTWSLYECSVYNNEMVPDGFGNQERRYSCTTQVQGKQKAWEVINAFCSAFKAKPYWINGGISFWQDRPGNAVRQFTNADVENGDFKYSSSALRSRFTRALVTWNDPGNFYKRVVEPYDDVAGINRIGLQEIEISAFGCVTRGLALRTAKWALFSSQYETETVTFCCRSWAALVRPGEIVQIFDNRKSNLRYAGLIKSGTSTTVQLDQAVDLRGNSFQITIMKNDGTLQTRDISDTAGLRKVINVTSAFSNTPVPNSNFIIQSNKITAKLFRVISVVPDFEDPTKVEITCINYYPDKFDVIEKDAEFNPDEYKNLNKKVPVKVSKPKNVKIGFGRVLTDDGSYDYNVLAEWEPAVDQNNKRDAYVKGYVVEYKRGKRKAWQGTTFLPKGVTSHQWDNLSKGNYTVRVCSIDVFGRYSRWNESDTIRVGKINNKSTNVYFNYNDQIGSLGMFWR